MKKPGQSQSNKPPAADKVLYPMNATAQDAAIKMLILLETGGLDLYYTAWHTDELDDAIGLSWCVNGWNNHIQKVRQVSFRDRTINLTDIDGITPSS